MYKNMKGFKTFMGSHEGVDSKHIPEWQRPTKRVVCNICGRETDSHRMVLTESRFNEPEPESEYCIDCLNNEGNE